MFGNRCDVVAPLTRIGWNGDLEQEGQAVAQLLKMDWLKVKNDVHRLHDRLGIAPPGGRDPLHLPGPLALYLALEAIEIYGERLREIPAILPTEAARDAFYQRLGELAGFPQPTLVPGGTKPFFFLSLLCIEIRPVAGLIRSGRSGPSGSGNSSRPLEAASLEERLQFVEGRREVVWKLVQLAWPQESFEDAMFALAELAVAENESWTNNSTGEFCDRFQVYLAAHLFHLPNACRCSKN